MYCYNQVKRGGTILGFGKKLEEKMLEKGLKQADLVRATGISKTTLSSMISRDNTKVDVEVFIRICDVLGCAPEDFASDIPKNISQNGDILTPDEKELLDTYRNFNDEGKEKLLDTASDMAQLDRYKKCAKFDVAEKEA